ncbi:hypothetical protein FISHEDRAFT_77697 [Fistulina hepatica ATCC 64428]|nr:hypothetical protein FISHEDRAFT_77697 [Fistulina hepatica ATCC 64428]
MSFGGFGTFGSSNPQTQPKGTSIFGQTSTPGASTSTANQTSTFGGFGQQANATAPKPGGLFGQITQQPAATGGLFGQQQQPQQQQQTGGLFGQSVQQPATGGSMFGQPTQQQTGGGLFGQAAQTTQPTGISGGLFGQATQQQQQNQQPATTSLFGQSAQQAQQPTTGGLFGQTTQPATSGTLFGQTTGQTMGGLFGAKPTQPPQGGSLFGSTAANTQQPKPTFGGFGSSMFGAQQMNATSALGAPAANNAVAQSAGAPPFVKSTKFNDLPDNIKQTFEQIEKHIEGRVQISKGLQARKLGQEVMKEQDRIRELTLDDIRAMVQRDLKVVKDLSNKTDQAVHDTLIATRIVDAAKNPQADAAFLRDNAEFPIELFTRVADEMREKLAWYKITIEARNAIIIQLSSRFQHTPQTLSASIQAQNSAFLALASRTAALHNEVQKLKHLYRQVWRNHTGSARDPFNELDVKEMNALQVGDLGFGNLAVR